MTKLYHEQFNYNAAIAQELKDLKNTIQTQKEAVNASTIIIDELRKENELLKKNLYTQELNNEIGKYKQLWIKATDDYSKLFERHELLMRKYITNE